MCIEGGWVLPKVFNGQTKILLSSGDHESTLITAQLKSLKLFRLLSFWNNGFSLACRW